ncbi:hypothetical protein GCM10019016_011820 [Streptomyces prasinosporus]|uniref:Uncharacterized protein n=1 Tax=Streptomyces prasinosporus TaxID=68256 RepID=A0ABP6THS9_9ACTN|nr:hypothetical protein GCM10010332_67850 [Streptomyces albogriseolus]
MLNHDDSMPWGRVWKGVGVAGEYGPYVLYGPGGRTRGRGRRAAAGPPQVRLSRTRAAVVFTATGSRSIV